MINWPLCWGISISSLRHPEKAIYHDMFIYIGMVMSWNDLSIDLSKSQTNKANKLSAEEDKRVVDHIMYPENLIKAVDGEIIEMEPQLSDHKPVWALLQLKL